MMATKEQERKALEEIRNIVSELGEDSYIGKAFEGCYEIAEENIENDFWISMEDKYTMANRNAAESKDEASRYKKQIERLEKQVERLAEQLEREQEWKPYVDTDNVSQENYESVAGAVGVHFLTDDEAKELLYQWYGFAKEKVKIVRTIPKREVNRHRQLRKVGEIDRKPAYNATDWNYICFNCGMAGYELFNGDLNFYIV